MLKLISTREGLTVFLFNYSINNFWRYMWQLHCQVKDLLMFHKWIRRQVFAFQSAGGDNAGSGQVVGGVNLARGKFLNDWDTATKVPWGILILFGGGLAIAAGFSDSGLAEWIGMQLSVLEGSSILIIMLPVATPPNAVIFGSGYITIPQMARAGMWLNILAVIVITLFAYFWLPFVFGF